VFLGSRLLANQTWPFRAGLGAKSMKVAPGGLIQQGQQRGSEVLHLLLRLGAGLGCIRVKQGTEPGDFIRKPVILSRKDRNLLLSNPGSGLGLVPLLLTLAESKPPVTPAEGAALAAAVTVLLPRIGWILAAAAVGGWIAHDDSSTGAIIGVAAAPLPLLLFWRPTWWSAPGLAIGLGWLGVAGAFPAIAGQARGIWTRAVLGAAGFWWLSLAEIVLHKRLLLGPASSLRDLVSMEWLALGAVWAAAAALLPLFVRGRNVGTDLLGALVWATATAVASEQLAKAVGASDPRGLVGAAATAAVLSVLAQALRRT